MKAGETQIRITQIQGRHKSTTSRELALGSGRRGYRPRQVHKLSVERSQCSRNAASINEHILFQERTLLSLRWYQRQIANKLPSSHVTIYKNIYVDKAMGGHLWRSLRCQKQKRKRYAGGRDRRGHIQDRRSTTERPELIERRASIEHLETNRAAHQHVIITLVKRKSSFAVMTKVNPMTSDQVSAAFVKRHKPIATWVERITYDNGRELAGHKGMISP